MIDWMTPCGLLLCRKSIFGRMNDGVWVLERMLDGVKQISSVVKEMAGVGGGMVGVMRTHSPVAWMAMFGRYHILPCYS
jgi:acyl-coenzyme A synthetase/AMP-(fatty) acid ligase